VIPAIDAELAGHVDKLDVKLQSWCGNGFSSFAVRILAKPLWSEFANNLRKQRWNTFRYPQF